MRPDDVVDIAPPSTVNFQYADGSWLVVTVIPGPEGDESQANDCLAGMMETVDKITEQLDGGDADLPR